MENPKLKEYLLETFQSMVLQNGLKETKMEDVSKALGISKKTIYKYYRSKDALVFGVIEKLIDDISEIIDRCLLTNTRPVEQYIELIGSVQQYLVRIDQRFMQEIQENYPSLFMRMNEIRAEKLSVFHKIINEGVVKGDFKTIHPAVATQMIVSSITAILNPAYLIQNSITIEEAITDLKTIFLSGIIK